MSLPGEALTTVIRPSSDPEDWAYSDAGERQDLNRQADTAWLVIDPLSQGQLQRTLGDGGAWTGGAIRATSERTPLYPEDDFTGRPADWIVFEARVYRVVDRCPWPDPDLPSEVMTAVLMRPQPQIPNL